MTPRATTPRSALQGVVALLLLALVAATWSSTMPATNPASTTGEPGSHEIAGAAVPVASTLAADARRRGAGRPNIVLITTDDQTLSDLRWMPRTRRLLGGGGATFTRALSPHPLCCPARAAILTGQYAQNNGVKSNQAPFHFKALKSHTALPVWLKRAGYRTAFTGKYLNGYGTNGKREPGWSYWDPTMQGQYAYSPFVMNNNGNRRYYGEVNNIDYINARTSGLVRRWSGDRKPFFIWASHVAPHGRFDKANGVPTSAVALPPTRYRKKFRQVSSPSLRDRAFNEADVRDKNSLVRSKRPSSRERINQIFRSRIRSLQAVDDGVQDLVRTLKRTGELSNTYVFFTSDNGFLLGEHRLVTKNVPYHQSLEVPMLVRGPGIPRGVRRDQRALMVDLAPTFADIAGARPRVRVDGASLLPALRRNAPLRNTVLIQAGPSKQTDDGGAGWFWRGVTTDRYTYSYFFGDELEELYDRRRDPGETYNLDGNPLYAGVQAELLRRTVALLDCAGVASCSRDFGPMPDPLPVPLPPEAVPSLP